MGAKSATPVGLQASRNATQQNIMQMRLAQGNPTSQALRSYTPPPMPTDRYGRMQAPRAPVISQGSSPEMLARMSPAAQQRAQASNQAAALRNQQMQQAYQQQMQQFQAHQAQQAAAQAAARRRSDPMFNREMYTHR